LIKTLGIEWRGPVASRHAKFLDRRDQIVRKSALVDRYLPEVKDGGWHCLDLSCGNGVLLEVLRHYGNTIVGADREHFEFLKTQQVPFVEFDGDSLPYPFEDQSFDLVTSVGSITFYNPPWEAILAEFCRIARKTVLLVVNQGWILDDHLTMLQQWTAPGWKNVLKKAPRYKWVRE